MWYNKSNSPLIFETNNFCVRPRRFGARKYMPTMPPLKKTDDGAGAPLQPKRNSIRVAAKNDTQTPKVKVVAAKAPIENDPFEDLLKELEAEKKSTAPVMSEKKSVMSEKKVEKNEEEEEKEFEALLDELLEEEEDERVEAPEAQEEEEAEVLQAKAPVAPRKEIPRMNAPAKTQTAVQTNVQTKTAAVVVTALAAGAVALAAAAALFSIPTKSTTSEMRCLGGLDTGRICTSDKQCRIGRCVKQERSTKPVATAPVATSPAANGSVFIYPAAGSVESDVAIVIAGSTNVGLEKFVVKANASEVMVRKLKFAITASQAVSSVKLFDGATMIGGPVAVNAQGVAEFSNLSLRIGANSLKEIRVAADLLPFAGTPVKSGEAIAVSMKGGSDIDIVNARTAERVQVGSDIPGATKIFRKSKPTVSLASLPNAVLTNGASSVLRFSVSADAAGDISFKKVGFLVNLSNAGGQPLALQAASGNSGIREVGNTANIDGFAAIALGDSASEQACSVSSTGQCLLQAVFSDEVVVPAGTTKTFDVRVVVSGADTAGDVVAARVWELPGSAMVTGELERVKQSMPEELGIDDTVNGLPVSRGLFLWSDMSAVPHNAERDQTRTTPEGDDDRTASNDWTNGVLVRALPSGQQTIAR